MPLPFSLYLKTKSSLLLEYSESFIDNLANKLAASVNDPTRVDEFKTYIRFFDTVRNTAHYQTYVRNNSQFFKRNNAPIADPKNIVFFNAVQLEHIFDQFSQENKDKKTEEEQQPIAKDAELVYPDDPSKTKRDINPLAVSNPEYMEIYCAGNKEKCIKFTNDVFGQNYSFCIGRQNSSNMYDTYRYQNSTEQPHTGPRTFYFVRDYSRPATDELHLIVVHALQNGKFVYTNAPNDNGDKYVGEFKNLVAVQPKLKGMQDKFKFINFNEQEELLMAVNNTDPFAITQLAPHLLQAYLDAGKPVPLNVFTELTTEQQNKYITTLFVNGRGDKLTHTRVNYLTPDRQTHERVQKQCYLNILYLLSNNSAFKCAEIIKQLTSEAEEDMIFIGENGYIMGYLFLLFNSEYYLDVNGNAVPRKDKRIQPLKYFVYTAFIKKGNHTIPVSRASELLAQRYSRRQDIANLAIYVNKATPTDLWNTFSFITSVVANDKTFVILNTTLNSSGEKEPTMFCFDNKTFKLVYKPCMVVSTSPHGLAVQDIDSDSVHAINFEGDNIIPVDNPSRVIADNNFIGPLSLKEIKAADQKTRNALIIKRFKHALLEHKNRSHNSAYTFFHNQFFKEIISLEDSEYNKLFANACKNAAVKIQIKNSYDMYESIMSSCRGAFQLKYLSTLLTDEALDFYNKNILPVIHDIIQTEFETIENRTHNTPCRLTNNLLFKSSWKGIASIFDLTTLEFKAVGYILMYTKNSIILGDKNTIKGFNNAIGFDKQTLNLISNESLTKIKNTFASITKLKNSEAADVIATSNIEYGLSISVTNSLAKKAEVNTDDTFNLPPYNSLKKGSRFTSKALFIDVYNNKELQDKYLKFLQHNTRTPDMMESFKHFLKTIKNLRNIQLSCVLLQPSTNYYGGARYKIGYIFSNNSINSPKNIITIGARPESFYIEISSVDLGVTTDKDNKTVANCFSKTQKFFDKETNVIPVQKYNAAKCFIIQKPKSGTLSINSLITQYMSYDRNSPLRAKLFNSIINTSRQFTASEMAIYDSNNKVVKEENVEIPFSIFYKLFS